MKLRDETINLTEKHLKGLAKLANDKSWDNLKEIVDILSQFLANDAALTADESIRHAKIDELASGIVFWNRVRSLVERDFKDEER